MRRNGLRFCLLPVSMLILIGCTGGPPTFQTGPDAEVTFDGLVRVDNTAFKRVWADPDADLSVYTKVLPQRAEVEFRAVKGKAGRSARLSSGDEFPITDDHREQLTATISAVLFEEIGRNKRFLITAEPDPETLILAVSLLDIVSHVPPEIAGRGNIYISTVGEVTLVLELKDAPSGETLIRAAERRAVEPAGSIGMRSTTVTNRSEVRRAARQWGNKIRNGLDSL